MRISLPCIARPPFHRTKTKSYEPTNPTPSVHVNQPVAGSNVEPTARGPRSLPIGMTRWSYNHQHHFSTLECRPYPISESAADRDRCSVLEDSLSAETALKMIVQSCGGILRVCSPIKDENLHRQLVKKNAWLLFQESRAVLWRGACQTGEQRDNDTERRDARVPRMVRMLREHPTSLETNPTCSGRVLCTAKLAQIPLNYNEPN